MKHDVAIVGGGLLGRLLAWRAALSGLDVALYDANDRLGNKAAAWVAGGMVSPQAEAADAEPELVAMGRRSLSLWPEWLSALSTHVHYSDSGTLLVWHRADAGEAARFESLLRARDPQAQFHRLDRQQLAIQEATLGGRFREALYLPGEAHLDNRQLLLALADALDELGVECHWNRRVEDTEPPMPRLSWIVEERAQRVDGRKFVECVANWCVYMLQVWNCGTCFACCILAIRSM